MRDARDVAEWYAHAHTGHHSAASQPRPPNTPHAKQTGSLKPSLGELASRANESARCVEIQVHVGFSFLKNWKFLVPCRLFLLAFDTRADRTQLRVERLIAAIEMIDTADFGLVIGDESGKNEAHRSA
jgi:hypothetical protein